MVRRCAKRFTKNCLLRIPWDERVYLYTFTLMFNSTFVLGGMEVLIHQSETSKVLMWKRSCFFWWKVWKSFGEQQQQQQQEQHVIIKRYFRDSNLHPNISLFGVLKCYEHKLWHGCPFKSPFNFPSSMSSFLCVMLAMFHKFQTRQTCIWQFIPSSIQFSTSFDREKGVV